MALGRRPSDQQPQCAMPSIRSRRASALASPCYERAAAPAREMLTTHHARHAQRCARVTENPIYWRSSLMQATSWNWLPLFAGTISMAQTRLTTLWTHDMKMNRMAITVALLMCTVSVAGIVVRPSATAREKGTGITLETAVPKGFADWTELPEQSAQVVNPQTKELLDKLYSQILTRSYVNKDGYKIMLSLAYGDDQRGGLQAHRPEVCYPAQGFKLGTVEDGQLATTFGNIEVRRLSTSLGSRNEPITYWLTVGDQVIRSKLDKRIAEIRLGLTGQIPDGLLFRISSIDNDPIRAFAVQQKFVADMMASVPVKTRRQLSGLVAPTTPI